MRVIFYSHTSCSTSLPITLVTADCLLQKIPQTEWLKNKYLFLTILEARKSKIKVLAGLVSGENFPTGLQTDTFLLYPHVAERERRKERDYFHTYNLTISQRLYYQMLPHQELALQHMSLEEHKHSIHSIHFFILSSFCCVIILTLVGVKWYFTWFTLHFPKD